MQIIFNPLAKISKDSRGERCKAVRDGYLPWAHCGVLAHGPPPWAPGWRRHLQASHPGSAGGRWAGREKAKGSCSRGQVFLEAHFCSYLMCRTVSCLHGRKGKWFTPKFSSYEVHRSEVCRSRIFTPIWPASVSRNEVEITSLRLPTCSLSG